MGTAALPAGVGQLRPAQFPALFIAEHRRQGAGGVPPAGFLLIYLTEIEAPVRQMAPGIKFNSPNRWG